MKQEKGIISMNNILAIQQEIEGNKAGIRSQAGTVIKNQNTGEVIYTPPQDPTEIKDLMQELLEYINLDSGEHPLIKMALIHHQFESIHPFFDGNGRTGRILNLLYLIQAKRLSLPVLYLSRFINHNKSEYYRLLQAVRNESSWKEWVIYMLTGIAMTAAHTTDLINQIQDQFTAHKDKIRSNYKFYSHELLNHIYAYPYTRISFFSEELNVGRPTATKYLNQLSSGGILTKVEKNNRFYYINHKLYDILTKTPSLKISNSQ
ncbi:MAG: Fic family protein [Candidatus Portiera sp.]|nr:Fic family protein [Portiera sp.]